MKEEMPMARGAGFQPKDPQAIIDRYLAGEAVKDIASDFGYTHNAPINKLLKNAGVQLRTQAAIVAAYRSRNV